MPWPLGLMGCCIQAGTTRYAKHWHAHAQSHIHVWERGSAAPCLCPQSFMRQTSAFERGMRGVSTRMEARCMQEAGVYVFAYACVRR